MMTIISTVLTRALDLKAKSFQENHLQKVLYLIGYGLQEELTGHYPFLAFYARAQEFNLLNLLEELSRSPRVEAHRDFILWTIKKFKEVQAKEDPLTKSNNTSSCNDANMINMEEASGSKSADKLVETPLTAAEQEKREKEERSKFAAAHRAKIMAQMQSAQRNFMQSNADMFASATNVVPSSESASGSTGTAGMEWQGAETNTATDEEGAVALKRVACLGIEQRVQQLDDQKFKCILCFEECSVTKDGPCLVYSAFVQKSKVLPPEAKYDYSVYTSSCGHVMHGTCWQEYYNNEEIKDQRRPHRNMVSLFPFLPNVDFQCPYCRYVSNTVIPLTPPLSKYAPSPVVHAGDSVFLIDQWIVVLRGLCVELNILRSKEDRDMWHCFMPELHNVLKESNLTTSFELMINPMNNSQDLPEGWKHYLQNYVQSLRHFTPTNFTFNKNEGLLWMWHSCIYTIEALEVYMRAIGKPFKDEMSIRHESCLSGLIRACCLKSAYLAQEDFRYLVEPVADLINTVLRQGGKSVLEWNCFSLLASTIFMVPNVLIFSKVGMGIVPSGSMMEFYTLQLFFLANMVKAIVLFEAPISDSMDMDIEEEIEFLPDDMKNIPLKLQENIKEFYRKYNIPARRNLHKEMSTDTETTGDDEAPSTPESHIECNLLTITALFEHIKTEMREFLRCSCLFFHFVTDVEFPDEFASIDGDTYDNMCKYLGLQPDLATYFDYETEYATIMDMYASHKDIVFCDFDNSTLLDDTKKQIVPCSRPVPQLVSLPEDFSDLINSVSDFICPNNQREEIKSPTMCLICGKILCGQSYCCQPELDDRPVGACTYHTNSCAANVGIFLRIRDCQVVYLSSKKGCFVQPPYLDEYGETDQGLRRGNPLRLCPERYSKIQLHWLGHSLHEEIARLNENTPMPVTQWHHM